MRRTVDDYRGHHHGGRDTHHHHHVSGGGGGSGGHHPGGAPGGGGLIGPGGSSAMSQANMHHHPTHHNNNNHNSHHHHHQHQPPPLQPSQQQHHHTHHRHQNNFHHPIQHRSSSSSHIQHLPPRGDRSGTIGGGNSNHRHRSRTSSLSMGMDGPPPSSGLHPPPPLPPSASIGGPVSGAPLSQLDSRISEMNIGYPKSSRDRLSSPLTSHGGHHVTHTNHHHHHPPHHHRRSYLGSGSSGSSGSSSGSVNGGGNSVSMLGGGNNGPSMHGSVISDRLMGGSGSGSSGGGPPGTPATILTSPSHSSAVLSKLERKRRLLACLDGGTAPQSGDEVERGGTSDRNSIISGGGGSAGGANSASSSSSLAATTNSTSRIPLHHHNPPTTPSQHASNNSISNNSDLTTHSSLAKVQQQYHPHHQQQQQQQHHHSSSHASPLSHHQQHHHSTSTTSYHHHHNHHNQSHHSANNTHAGPVHPQHNSSSSSNPISRNSPTLKTVSMSHHLAHRSPSASIHHHQPLAPSKLSSSSSSVAPPYSPSHPNSIHLSNNSNINNNNNDDNINKTPISTNDLNRRISYLSSSHKTASSTISLMATSGSNTNNNMNDNSIRLREPMQTTMATPTAAPAMLSPLSTPYATTHRSNSTSGGGIKEVGNTQTQPSIAPAATLPSNALLGASDKPKKTSLSYSLPNSIYNKAGTGQKSSTLSSYTQLLSIKGDDSKTIDIGSQGINTELQDPRLKDRLGSVLTTITNNEDFLTRINSSLDDQITLVDSIRVTSSELTKRNKIMMKNPTTSQADSTTHKIDDQSSSEVSSSSDADLSRLQASSKFATTTMAATTTNFVLTKPVMNLPLPKFACAITLNTSEMATKKPTPDRELTTVSSSNKLLLNKTPLLSLSTTRNRLSPASLASFSCNDQTATATTAVAPTVDYSKFNIRKKSASTSMTSIDQATSLNTTASTSASSDDEKTSPLRVEIETDHIHEQSSILDDSEDHSTQVGTIEVNTSALSSPILTERKLSLVTSAAEPPQEPRKSPELKIAIDEREPGNMIRRRISTEERPISRKGSLSPPKVCRIDKISPLNQELLPKARVRVATPEVKQEAPIPPQPKGEVAKKAREKEKDKKKEKDKDKSKESERAKISSGKTSLEKKDKTTAKIENKEDKVKPLKSEHQKSSKTVVVNKPEKKIEKSTPTVSPRKIFEESDDDHSDSSEGTATTTTTALSSSKKSDLKDSKLSSPVMKLKSKKLESKKLTRKKFELKLKERMQIKSRDKFKMKTKRSKNDEESSTSKMKMKSQTKRGLKGRVKTKGNMKGRDKTKQKKSSLFSFEDEPIYLSMYDKVKARSCKNQSYTTPAPSEPSTFRKDSSSIKELSKQRKQKRPPKPSSSRTRKDSSSSSSISCLGRIKSDSDSSDDHESSITLSPPKSKPAPPPPSAPKITPKNSAKKSTKKNEQKKFMMKDFELLPSDIRPQSPSTRSNSSKSSSSSSTSSSSSSGSSSASSMASLSSSSSSSENEEDEDAELSAIVAEAAGRIGQEIMVREAANSPQLSPPPSPVMDSSFLMSTPSTSEPPKTSPVVAGPPPPNMEEIMAKSSDSWTNLISQPLHINLAHMSTHSVTNTPSPRRSGPSELVLSSPSICARSLAPTPECSPGANKQQQVPSLAPEPSTLDSRCETEQAISTLLMEMDTDQSKDLLIEADTRASISNASLSPRKSPAKMSTPPPPATPSPPISLQHQRQTAAQTPPRAVATTPGAPVPTPSPTLVATPSIDCPMSPLHVDLQPQLSPANSAVDVAAYKSRTPSPRKHVDRDYDHSPNVVFGPDPKPVTPECLPTMAPLSLQTFTDQIASSGTPPRESSAKIATPDAVTTPPCKIVADTQPGKHALNDDTSPTATDEARQEVKRARRNRKKSLHNQANAPTCVDVNTPRLSSSQQAKMSPYDIFEFRDSDDDESTTGKKPADEASAARIKSPDMSSSSAINISPQVTCKLATPPISTNLLQTVASMQSDSPMRFTPPSPKLPLNLAQPESIQRTPPQPAVSPSNSSNENKDPAQEKMITPLDNQLETSLDLSNNLLQAVELKTDLLKSLAEPLMKVEASEESIDHLDPDQRQREYVTELSQDGKLSLTIRKASNQAREMGLESSRFIGRNAVEPSSGVQQDTHLGANTQPVVPSDSASDSGKSGTSQTNQSANIKPTRRSARLMQTGRKEPAQDEQGPKEAHASSAHPPIAAAAPISVPSATAAASTQPKAQNLSVSSKEPSAPLVTPRVESKSPAPPAVSDTAQRDTTNSEGVAKESQPPTSMGGDQVEPPTKTRRYARGKKAKHQAHSQPQDLAHKAEPQAHQINPQPEIAAQPLIIQSQQTPIKPQEPSTSQAAPATDGVRRPKRLTRLAAKTYGGSIPDPTTVDAQSSAVQPAPVVEPAPPEQSIKLPVQQQPQQPIPPPQPQLQPLNVQSHQQQYQQQPFVSQPQSIATIQPAQYSGNAPLTTTNHLNTKSTNSAPPIVPSSAVVAQPPIRNLTPVVETTHPLTEPNKVASFCIPSYLPPRKRLGWFWSQKQLLEQRYLVVWTSAFTLKDAFAAVQMHFISGNNKLPSISYRALLNEAGLPLPIQINQRMRLMPEELEGVRTKMANEEDHCVLLAVPVGRDQTEYLKQSASLRVGFIDYLTCKEAAGIVHVFQPGEAKASYIIHIFPSCTFVNDHILQREPDLLNVTQNIDNLIVVITTA